MDLRDTETIIVPLLLILAEFLMMTSLGRFFR